MHLAALPASLQRYVTQPRRQEGLKARGRTLQVGVSGVEGELKQQVEQSLNR